MAGFDARDSEPMPSHENRDASIPNIEDRPRIRQYLSLQRLDINQLPSHPEFPAPQNENRTSLVQFLNLILAEVAKVDFDRGWISHGKWQPDNTGVLMPLRPIEDAVKPAMSPTAMKDTGKGITKLVPISVERRLRTTDRATWLTRTSFHLETDVKYSELDDLLSHEHSRNEARYTPSVYDANELLTWSPQDLEKAVVDLHHGYNVQGVQMSIFQMFHKMPGIVGGFSLLDDRIFHVLVITVHFTKPVQGNSSTPQSNESPSSFTVQLPVDIGSFKEVSSMMQKSHVQNQGSSQRYYFPSNDAAEMVKPSEAQKQRIGKKLTEGNYVSLERLCKASKELPPRSEEQSLSTTSGYHHRWDMMTLSTAGGITRLAPKRVEHNETLKAIAADVQYVVEHIAKARQNEIANRLGDSRH
ncbi:Nn.00g098530.m01.CDS01 [Neocucurbitaria sp. VM-36]